MPLTRDFFSPGRSSAYAANAMAATSSPAATLAALDVMRRGGNAVDAAVAAAAVLCVTEPHMTGIGGDCFAMIAKPDGTRRGLNGAGRSAGAANASWLANSGLTEIAFNSVHAVTVPGAIDAWDMLLKEEGSITLAEALRPAIALAEAGSPTLPRVARDWQGCGPELRQDPGASRHYLLNGKAPREAELMRYPALARSLTLIAQQGRDGFYQGEIADDMLMTLKARGSLLTPQDFAATRATWVTPLSTTYHDHEIWQLPPSGQGLTVLLALNILKHFDMAALDPEGADRKHLEIEALKRAWHLRNRHIGDPQMVHVPVAELLSDEMARRLAASINIRQASDIKVDLPPSDTVYLCVVDHERRACSLINSIYWSFGSGIVTEKTGITLQNRGASFSCDPQHPNVIAPNKRPLHTIIPALTSRHGKTDMVFGVMDGDFQPMGHVNMVLNRYAYGLDPQTSLDLPRCVPSQGQVEVERNMPLAVCRDLEKRGHRLTEAKDPLGGGQIIAINHHTGLLQGGSDPRKDGCALGF